MKQKIGFGVCMFLIIALLFSSPWDTQREVSAFSSILNEWGAQQAETSDKFTNYAVSGMEGTVVGEHKVDGSNWAIPNIIRHWLGVG